MKKLLAITGIAVGLAVIYGDQQTVKASVDRLRDALGIEQSADPQHRYIEAALKEGTVEQTVTTTGTLNAIVNVEVGSQLSGQVSELYVDFNDEVEKGQPLALLDPRTFQARVDEAEAAVQVAEATVAITRQKLERARIDLQDSEAQRAVLKARTDSARVRSNAAHIDMQRKISLRERQVGSAVELDDATVKAGAAAAGLREAEAIAMSHENAVAAAAADIRRLQAELAAAAANVPEKKAALRIAQIELERSTIRSPLKGVVVGRTVNAGQTLATALEAKTLFTVAGDLRQMEIDAKVDEADIGKIKTGQEATFTVDAHPGEKFTARVWQIRKAPQVQQNVVTYTVVLSVANADKRLLPGMTALVRIKVNEADHVVKLPLSALRFEPAGAQRRERAGATQVVWVLSETGAPEPVKVTVGPDDGTDAALAAGALHQGDRVIVGEVTTKRALNVFGIRLGL